MTSLNCDDYRDALIILSKTILIRHLGTISDPYTPLDHQIYLLIISLHLKIDCVSVYVHYVYDITKLRWLQGWVDYTVKNNLDSSSRQHFRPIYTFRSSNLFIDHFIASKNRLQKRLWALKCMISLNWEYYRDVLIILLKTILIRHLGTISDLYTPLDHQMYSLIIPMHLKIDCINVYGHLVYDISKLGWLRGCVDYTVKNDLDSSSRHHFWTIYTLDHQIYLLLISLHLKIDCVSVYGHLEYDITKLRWLQGCVDYTVKNDHNSSSRHHFWPIYTFRS